MKQFFKLPALSLMAIFLMLVLPRSVNAQVDIELAEDEDNNSISVLVDSNGSYIDGIILRIIHSEDLVVDEENVTKSEELCTFNNTLLLSGDSFSIECFNDLDTVMDGEIIRIPFFTDLEEYYFYVDQDLLDIGLLSIGTVTDINRPDNIVFEDFEFTEKEETVPVSVESKETTGTLEGIRSFLTENSLYILIGIISLISVAIIIIFITSEEKKTKKPIQ